MQPPGESTSSSKEWPALGQPKKRKGHTPKATSFAAALKAKELEEGGQQTVTDVQTSEKAPAISWEERKAAVRAAKLANKEERRLRREENVRRQLQAPTGYRVQMISSVPGANPTVLGKGGKGTTFQNAELSFPELGARNVAKRIQEPINISQTGPPETVKPEGAAPSRKKKPDKHLVVTLEHLIKSRPKKIVTVKKRKVKLKTVFQEQLSGNPLDSSKPVRHRGKVREVPRAKRKSSLKNAILAYRKLKQLQREGTEKLQSNEKLADTESEDPALDTISEVQIESAPVCEPDFCQPISFKDIFHSRKFRDYCDNMLGKDLEDSVETLLKALAQMQDKSYQKDPQKYKKRILSGLHETKKAINMRKAKLVIIAPDLEKCPQPGGLDSKIAEIISLAKETSTPYLFSIGRRKLGKILFKKVPVSCAAITNPEGAEELLKTALALMHIKKSEYAAANVQQPLLSNPICEEKQSDVNRLVVSSLLNALEQSLQAPKTSEFLRVIDAIHANEESD
ncbi:Hypothetical predicted protein [Cloeon dipterum]|uniref:Ribosomal protein eL8/eL30/eS12/Gadd45 domain-containing protein n=1 Tax=Cloeon dipterum TaxID=197152 RepID=A0A8S1DAL1_9INSE|nr:Hypothetical predicted protein [Cloeon dipterum]